MNSESSLISNSEYESTTECETYCESDCPHHCTLEKPEFYKLDPCQTFLTNFYPVYNIVRPDSDFNLCNNNTLQVYKKSSLLVSNSFFTSPDSCFEFCLNLNISNPVCSLPDTLGLRLKNKFGTVNTCYLKPIQFGNIYNHGAPISLIKTLQVVKLLRHEKQLKLKNSRLIYQNDKLYSVRKLKVGVQKPIGYKFVTFEKACQFIKIGLHIIYSYRKFFEKMQRIPNNAVNFEVCGLPPLESNLPQSVLKSFCLRPKIEPTIETIKDKLQIYMEHCHEADNMYDVSNYLCSKVDSSWISIPSFAQSQFATIVFCVRASLWPKEKFKPGQFEQLQTLLTVSMQLLDLPISIVHVIEKCPAFFIQLIDNGLDVLKECEELFDRSCSFNTLANERLKPEDMQ